jgi:hypothetical protein
MARGKSIDTEFVIAFIQECSEQGKLTPEEICEESLIRIANIDKQFKIRSKLSNVLSFFNYKKKSIMEDEKILFTDIDKSLSNIILDIIYSNNGYIHIDKLLEKFAAYDLDYKQELIFALKQMLEMNIVVKYDEINTISYGKNYKVFGETKV